MGQVGLPFPPTLVPGVAKNWPATLCCSSRMQLPRGWGRDGSPSCHTDPTCTLPPLRSQPASYVGERLIAEWLPSHSSSISGQLQPETAAWACSADFSLCQELGRRRRPPDTWTQPESPSLLLRPQPASWGGARRGFLSTGSWPGTPMLHLLAAVVRKVRRGGQKGSHPTTRTWPSLPPASRHQPASCGGDLIGGAPFSLCPNFLSAVARSCSTPAAQQA